MLMTAGYQENAFMLIGYDNTLSRVSLLFPRVGTLVVLSSLRTLDRPFGAINEDAFNPRELLKQLLHGTDLSFRELDLFAQGFL